MKKSLFVLSLFLGFAVTLSYGQHMSVNTTDKATATYTNNDATGVGTTYGLQSFNTRSEASASSYGIYARTYNDAASTTSYAVYAVEDSQNAASTSVGVYAVSNGAGSNRAIYASTNGTGTDDYAAFFEGPTYVSGPRYMFDSGTTNPDKMIIAHSPAFATWGMQYSDLGDIINFKNGTANALSIDLVSLDLAIGGDIDVTGAVTFGSVESISDGGAFTIESNSTFRPDVDLVRDLGTSTLAWDWVYYDDLSNQSFAPGTNEEVKSLNKGLKAIMKATPVSFKSSNDPSGKVKTGFDPEQLINIIPEAVTTQQKVVDDEGNVSYVAAPRKGINYDALIPVMIKGMQEQQEIIETLKARIADLEEN